MGTILFTTAHLVWVAVFIPLPYGTVSSVSEDGISNHTTDYTVHLQDDNNSTGANVTGSEDNSQWYIHYKERDVLICPQFSCQGRCDVSGVNLTIASCFCDDICFFYGDCCYDAEEQCGVDGARLHGFDWLTDQQPRCSNFFEKEYALLIDRCHGDWPSDDIRRNCEDQREDTDDIFTTIPVTDTHLHIAFKSVYCALCNFLEIEDLNFWDFNISCEEESALDIVDHNMVSFAMVADLEMEQCHVRLKPRENEVIGHVRYCNPRFVNACRTDMAENVLLGYNDPRKAACSQYSAYVVLADSMMTRNVVKNTHCAVCMNNNTELSSLSCPVKSELLLDFHLSLRGLFLPPFSVVLDFNGYNWRVAGRLPEPVTQICANDSYFLTGHCRDVICMEGFRREGDLCVPVAQGDHNVIIELIVSSPQEQVVGAFQDMLIHEAMDHGVLVENITTHVPTQDLDLLCGESLSSAVNPNVMDVDIVIAENKTSLLALMGYVDDLIGTSQVDVANVKISSIEYDSPGEAACGAMEYFTIATNSSREGAYLVAADGLSYTPDQVVWEVVWRNGCVGGRLRPTTNKTIRGCVKPPPACLLIAVTQHELDSINRTMWSMLNDTTFVSIDNGTYVCISVLKNMYEEYQNVLHNPNSDLPERILTAVFLPMSILCLIITIVTHCVIPRLNSLPGRIVLSLSVTLLVAQVLFLSIEAAVSLPWLCTGVAVVEHYLWLSTFSWSNILALDLETTLTKSTKVGLNRDRESAFRRYSAYGWGAPFVLVTVVTMLSFFTSLPVTYGDNNICWLLYQEALLFGFALPVAVAVLTNCFLFSRAIYFVWKVGKLVKNASIVQDQKAKTFLYVKLVFLMGLTWLLGIIGTALHNQILMYLFTIFNSLQGVYMFVAFACNKRIFRFYRRLLLEKVGSSRVPSSQASKTTSESKLSSH